MFLVAFLFFILILVVFITGSSPFSLSSFGLTRKQESMVKAWNEHNYDTVYTITSKELQEAPLETDNLILHGYSAFYSGIAHYNTTEAHNLFSEAIISLRKALVLTPEREHNQIHYVIGKAYYHLGPYYYDLAARHLSISYKKGFIADDLFEYLGLAYKNISENEEASKWLTKAIDANYSSLTDLKLAEVYFSQGKYAIAADHAATALKASEDSFIQARANLLIGKTMIEREMLDQARIHFLSMVETNQSYADARYWLGEVYNRQNQPILARAEWREAVRIDPQHALAAARLRT